jgi:Glycosyltransferase Family 4
MALMEATSVTGPAKNLIEFARRASCHGADIVVATFERAGAGSAFAGAVRLAGVPVGVIAERRRFDPGILPALRAAAAECRPDIVQSHNVKSHFLVRLLKLHHGRPWIAFHHGYTAADYRRLDRWSLPAATRVVAVCHAFTDRLREIGVPPDRISVRHNMAMPFAPAGASEVAELRARLGVPEGARVLLSVGRRRAKKDIRTCSTRLPS